LAIWSGVAIAASNSSQPPWIFSGGLTGAVRQVDRAADHLVRLTRVDTEPYRHLDGRVLLARRRFLGELGGFQRGVEVVAIHLFGGGAVCLAVLAHCSSNLVLGRG
jgi:hypothetical protein